MSFHHTMTNSEPSKISNKVFPFRDVCSEFDNVLFAELCVDDDDDDDSFTPDSFQAKMQTLPLCL